MDTLIGDLRSPTPEAIETHDVWIATGFSVRAASPAEAEARAAAWLTTFLASAKHLHDVNDLSDPNITVTYPAQGLHSAAVLAVQLMALERQDGEILDHVHRLRAQLAEGIEGG